MISTNAPLDFRRPLAAHGRWVRRGRTIVLLPAAAESDLEVWDPLEEEKDRRRKAGRKPVRKAWARSRYVGSGTAASTCTPAQHRQLQGVVKSTCQHYACHEGMTGCQAISDRGRRASACATARANINKECYGGGDARHREAQRQAAAAGANCRKIYRARQPACHSRLDFFYDLDFPW